MHLSYYKYREVTRTGHFPPLEIDKNMAYISPSDTERIRNVTYTLDFSHCGTYLMFPSDCNICIYDTKHKRLSSFLKGHRRTVWSAKFSPDGKRIVSGSHDRGVFIWCATSNKIVLRLYGHTDGVCSVAFSPDSERVVSGGYDNDIFIWCAISGQQLRRLKGHDGIVNSVAFCPDGKYIVSGSDDRTVRIWDSTEGRQHLQLDGHMDKVMSVMFSPDGTRIVSSSWDKTVRVWDKMTGLPQLKIQTSYTHVCLCAVFSHSGDYIAISGGSNSNGDSTVLICSARSGQILKKLDRHKDWVNSVAFSPDDKRVTSCGAVTRETKRFAFFV